MTPRLTRFTPAPHHRPGLRTVAAALAATALLAAPLSAYAAVTQPNLAQAAVTQPGLAEAATTQRSLAGAAVTRVHGPRDVLVSAVPVARLTAAQIDATAAAVGFVDAPQSRYDVTAYRLIYRTVTPDGRPTTASGLVVLPDGRRGKLTVVEYLHGTNATKADAATVNPASPDRAIAAMFAGSGLVTVAPDYLGLGLGPGRPPYLDLRTEVSSSADLLLAAQGFLARHGVVPKRDVLVTGFSQGGRASLAFSRALQRGEVGRFRLGAVSAVAGPYDLAGTELPAVFAGDVPPATATAYMAYMITAWDRRVGLYDDPADAFQAPYADTMEDLFDGTHTYEEIGAGLPGTLEELFTRPSSTACATHPAGTSARSGRATGSAPIGHPGCQSGCTSVSSTPTWSRRTPPPARPR